MSNPVFGTQPVHAGGVATPFTPDRHHDHTRRAGASSVTFCLPSLCSAARNPAVNDLATKDDAVLHSLITGRNCSRTTERRDHGLSTGIAPDVDGEGPAPVVSQLARPYFDLVLSVLNTLHAGSIAWGLGASLRPKGFRRGTLRSFAFVVATGEISRDGPMARLTVQIERGWGGAAGLNSPDECPRCHHSIQVVAHGAGTQYRDTETEMPGPDIVLLCPRETCRRLYLAEFVPSGERPNEPGTHEHWRRPSASFRWSRRP